MNLACVSILLDTPTYQSRHWALDHLFAVVREVMGSGGVRIVLTENGRQWMNPLCSAETLVLV